MKLRTRLVIVLGLTSLVGGVTLGVSFAYGARADGRRELDKTIADALAHVTADPNTDPAVLIDFAATSSHPLSASLFFDELPTTELVQQNDGPYRIEIPALTSDQLKAAVATFHTVKMEVPVRYKALKIGEGQWVVVAASLREVNNQFTDSFRRSLIWSLAVAVLLAAVVSMFVRRELRPLRHIAHDSQRIAAGDLDVELPVVSRSTEIGELSQSLGHMVNSLRSAIELTEKSEYRMREFLGDASHELRTPLTVIRGNIDILAAGSEVQEEQRERALRRLSIESRRMEAIINDLLLLAELGEVHADVHENVDLSAIVGIAAYDLKEQQPERPVHENITSGVVVEGNTTLLERLLSNLVSNIRQHTPPSAPVEFALQLDNNEVILTIDDGGPGLSSEMYSRVTTGFQRFDRSRSATGGGFGLGLSIISSIVTTHGGTWELQRSSLGGLRTRVVLPARR